jgi:hypothetical protein
VVAGHCPVLGKWVICSLSGASGTVRPPRQHAIQIR